MINTDLKKDDIVKFINKEDKKIIINGKITNIDNDRVYFINTDYPNVGICNFTFYSLNKFYNVIKNF